MRAARRALTTEDTTRMAVAVTDRLLGLPEIERARTVLVFSSFGTEIPTADLIARLVQEGKRVLLPFLEGEAMAAAEFVPGPEGALVQTTYGPKEPASRVPVHPGEVDVVILPGLAFDRAGYRLGYGGGYYDRYLTGLRPDAVRIGIGFAVQLVDAVPHGEEDARLDVTVTDRETVRHPARR